MLLASSQIRIGNLSFLLRFLAANFLCRPCEICFRIGVVPECAVYVAQVSGSIDGDLGIGVGNVEGSVLKIQISPRKPIQLPTIAAAQCLAIVETRDSKSTPCMSPVSRKRQWNANAARKVCGV